MVTVVTGSPRPAAAAVTVSNRDDLLVVRETPGPDPGPVSESNPARAAALGSHVAWLPGRLGTETVQVRVSD